MKLEKFDKNKKKKIYAIGGAVFLVVAIIGIVLFRSYALYQEEKSFNVLNGVVPDFSGDIQLAFTINGAKGEGAFPEKGSGYVVNNVTCNDGVEASWSNSDWALTNIKANNTKIKCNIGFETGHNLTNEASVGQYVFMTPSSTSYKISKSLTGYSSDQTINPSELNLWRIIKKNEDGTIEMVSENVSNTIVIFNGRPGYLNFVGILNEIAKQYENSKFTVGSRHMGYSTQTEYITDTSKFTETAPWTTTTNTHGNQYESLGGGDALFTTDTSLVTKVVGNLKANKQGSTATSYWLASRMYYYTNSTYYYWTNRIVNVSGSADAKTVYVYNNGWADSGSGNAVRPIVILKSELQAAGSGTIDSPWVLN